VAQKILRVLNNFRMSKLVTFTICNVHTLIVITSHEKYSVDVKGKRTKMQLNLTVNVSYKASLRLFSPKKYICYVNLTQGFSPGIF
jgi:hypothetical protein